MKKPVKSRFALLLGKGRRFKSGRPHHKLLSNAEANAMNPRRTPKTVDEYIATSPKNIQRILQQFRQAIKEAAPQAEEVISYQMPAFKQDGILVWFAAFKNHIGFYPKTSAIEAFKNRLVPYQTSKGTIRFPINEPIPLDLVKEIVTFRIKENLNKK